MDSSDDSFDAARNLIVNYLPPTLSQDDVKMLFSKIGPVSNCKLIRNRENGQSLGYAFIEYPNEQLAIDAISQFDGIKMQGKILKVSYARQSSPEIKNSNVYISGLPKSFTEDQLLTLFSPFGIVLTHKLLTNPDNTSRGVGFVRYSLKSEAQNAIDSMSGKTLPNSQNALTVKLAIPPASKQQTSGAYNTINSSSTLAAIGRGNLRYNPLAPSNQVVLSQQVASLPAPALPPGMETSSTAALTGMLTSGIPANPTPTMPAMFPNHAQQATQTNQICSLYIYGLQSTHSELSLYELFAPFGGILNVKLIRDLTKDDKPCKGFGFVNFRKYEEALAAVNTMNGCPFEGKILQVSFKQNKMPNGGLSMPMQPTHGGFNSNLQTVPNSMSGATAYSTLGSAYPGTGAYHGSGLYSTIMP